MTSDRAAGPLAMLLGGLALVAALPAWAAAQDPPAKTIAQATAGLERRAGLLPVYVDAKRGRVLLALTPDAKGDCGQFIYMAAMRSGLGSTLVGIDRSNPGPPQLLSFRRAGGKVMAELENTAFRADGGAPAEEQAVRESFPPSIVWSGDILAEDASGAILVDLSGFLVRDQFGVIDALKAAKQGDFRLVPERSYPDVAEVQTFPDNLELEAHETFVSDAPGDQVKGIAPEPHAVTLIEHHSLVRLPPPGFTPRREDPRTGSIDQLAADYGAPLGAPVVYRLAARFRLEKTDPAAARSPVRKPIVFYVDRAAPKPVRSALIDGARWWAQAFDAAGFIDAFRVEVLPEGVNPLDARYNVINWVHRQTRGWSYGWPITDPRTGEIVKGSVLLGSLRMRQDRMIFEGLVGADKTGTGASDDPIVVSLARLRQLAVHETGHALGLAHNFAGSTFGDRASVMDYPGPRVGITDGKLDFSDAYKAGIGDWDRFAIKWLYSEVPPGAAGQAALETVVRDGYARGLRYVSDDDARPTGSANPHGALWDDGTDAVAGLAHALEVRRIALARFGPANVPAGAPLSDLRRVIVPIYLFHRYEVDAVAKSIGGVDFNYGLRGDGAPSARAVDGAAQRRALEALLATLDPAVLDLPDALIDQLSTGRDGAADVAYGVEVFGGETRTPVFDITAAAQAAADITLGNLLEPSRLERVSDQGARDPSAMTLAELLNRTLDVVFAGTPATPRQSQLRRAVRARLVVKLAGLAEDKAAPPTVTADARAALDLLARRLAQVKTGDVADLAQARYFEQIIENRSQDQLAAIVEADHKRAAPPPGMPIGGEDCWFCDTGGAF
ncbi:MAG: zinc-dependent metalloprotease, subfamily 2 [Caulobacteraceae bacterium]|nr:zinc-dependent metalloprotease, subfamily 2 [Caulobacteraceae bacterium]